MCHKQGTTPLYLQILTSNTIYFAHVSVRDRSIRLYISRLVRWRGETSCQCPTAKEFRPLLLYKLFVVDWVVTLNKLTLSVDYVHYIYGFDLLLKFLYCNFALCNIVSYWILTTKGGCIISTLHKNTITRSTPRLKWYSNIYIQNTAVSHWVAANLESAF